MAKVSCPVCFTKMNEVGHDLVCPECGYKYCERKEAYTYDDHNHNQYRSYNQKTSYTTTPQQSSSTPRSSSAAQSYPSQRSAPGTQPNASYQKPSQTAGASSGNKPSSQNAVRKVITTIVVIYFVLWILFAILSVFLSNLDVFTDFENLERILESLS